VFQPSKDNYIIVSSIYNNGGDNSMKENDLKEKLKAGIIGHIVGDALGVPVEFKSRKELRENPVQKMRSYGTYNQPAGTWSDDSSLTLCLLDSLSDGYNLDDQADKFIDWLYNAYWTARNETFDVGNTTRDSISNLQDGMNPTEAGAGGERDNGNGSLMRILPLAFYLHNKDFKKRFKLTEEASSLTHSHPRSILGCYIYLDFALRLIEGKDLERAYLETKEHVKDFIISEPYKPQLEYYSRIINQDISKFEESEIRSSGYVVHSLEAVFWVLLSTNSYREAVLKAVNLGEDTDTIAAITGGLAAIHYGFRAIPDDWIEELARKEDIFTLLDQFAERNF